MIKAAFIWSKKNYYLSGEYADNCMYNFFMKRLKEHSDIQVEYIIPEGGGDTVDCRLYKNYDTILFYSAHPKFNPRLVNIEKLKNVPKFAMMADCHNYQTQAREMADYGEDINYFYTTSPEYFYKYVPAKYKFKQIVIGIDPDEGYFSLTPLAHRETEKILNTGLLRNKQQAEKRSLLDHYRLRRKCNELDYVNYVPKGAHVGKGYAQLLMTHRAAISASTRCFTLRHLEIALAGCVPFLEMTEQNGGLTLGFKDGENAIFINEDNYKEKFVEYLKTRHEKGWEDMALCARDFVMNNYTTKHGVDNLVKYMKETI